MSATLFAFLVVMCATPADCSEQSAGSCQPEPSMCDSSIGGDCCMSRKLSDEFRWCRDGWIPIYTGVLPLLRRCHSCVDPGKGSCLRRAALSTELLPRPCTVPQENHVGSTATSTLATPRIVRQFLRIIVVPTTAMMSHAKVANRKARATSMFSHRAARIGNMKITSTAIRTTLLNTWVIHATILSFPLVGPINAAR